MFDEKMGDLPDADLQIKEVRPQTCLFNLPLPVPAPGSNDRNRFRGRRSKVLCHLVWLALSTGQSGEPFSTSEAPQRNPATTFGIDDPSRTRKRHRRPCRVNFGEFPMASDTFDGEVWGAMLDTFHLSTTPSTCEARRASKLATFLSGPAARLHQNPFNSLI